MTEKDELLQDKERELAKAQQQLQSSEALVADFQRSLLQKDSELETLRAKVVSAFPHFLHMWLKKQHNCRFAN